MMTVKGIKVYELDIDIYRAVGSVNKFINTEPRKAGTIETSLEMNLSVNKKKRF
jgi:hypothetical protein